MLTLDELMLIKQRDGEEGMRLVQCHGCFDIVHPGHIRHLQFAASQGDRLLVSITADAFVNKGPNQPMFSDDLRAENLAALEFVDWVYIHHEPTAVSLLDQVKPDIYIKGAEYAQNDDPRFAKEREIVESHGGRVVFSSGEVVYSSTSIIESIQRTSRTDPNVSELAGLAQEYDLSTSSMQRVIKNASGKRLLVLGETILDTYTHCQWPEVAEEHPMLSLRPVTSEHFDGGGAIVAKHLAALGTRPILCTPVPVQFDADSFYKRMEQSGVEVMPILVDGEMPQKQRFLVGRDKVMKLDSVSRIVLNQDHRSELLEQVGAIQQIDGVVLTDFGLGMFSGGFAVELCESLRDRVDLIAGDVSGIRTDLLAMRGADVLCPSEAELRHAMNDQSSPVNELAIQLLELTQSQVAVVTRGQRGLTIITRGQGPMSLPALSQDPIDVLGSGDALLASLVVSMLGGGGLVQGGYIGSVAAAIAGSVMGNVPIGLDDLIAHSQRLAVEYAHSLSRSDPGATPLATPHTEAEQIIT